MIRLVDVTVRGESDLGPFSGSFEFAPGLQVVSAKNGFGKSLASTSIAWCLGLERMFGLQDNDPARFSMAVRESISLDERADASVRSSEACLTIERGDGERIRITRAIKGDPSSVQMEEVSRDGTVTRSSRLLARKGAMKDETGGLQRFLYGWAGLERVPVMTNRGEPAELYLENIAPLFFIDQSEGWTDLQALQVHRYGLLEVSEIAVEYLLGAIEAIQERFSRQNVAAHESRLKGEAVVIAAAVTSLFQRHGWIAQWSDHGSVREISDRWSRRTLAAVLKSEANVDLGARIGRETDRAASLRKRLSDGGFDPCSAAAASDASQAVVELKELRHLKREELRVLRRQRVDQEEILSSIEHRLHSARDILRLKAEGIGRLGHVECPTCHRSIAPEDFSLTSQSESAVRAHIDALSRDKRLIDSNVEAVNGQVHRLDAELSEVELKLREAERALSAVNQAVGAVREQMTKLANDLATAEREIERSAAIEQDLRDLQDRVEAWISEARSSTEVLGQGSDRARRVSEFAEQLGLFLRLLGHGELLAHPTGVVRLDERYVPYLGPRRLRSLGSASDQPRLVGAYALALASAAATNGGLHPGFVVLDEPLQQNPDEPHRNLFVDFLTSALLQETTVQTVIFTWLHDAELERVAAAGVPLCVPQGPHFLKLATPADDFSEMDEEIAEGGGGGEH